MTEPTYDGPRIGDRVAVTTAGSVVELHARNGVPGVTVVLDVMGTTWVPLTQVTVLHSDEQLRDALAGPAQLVDLRGRLQAEHLGHSYDMAMLEGDRDYLRGRLAAVRELRDKYAVENSQLQQHRKDRVGTYDHQDAYALVAHVIADLGAVLDGPVEDREARILHLEALPEGWDSYGSAPIQPGVGDRARQILAWFTDDPAISATAEGGIDLAWSNESVSIEVRPTGYTVVLDEAELVSDDARKLVCPVCTQWSVLGPTAEGQLFTHWAAVHTALDGPTSTEQDEEQA